LVGFDFYFLNCFRKLKVKEKKRILIFVLIRFLIKKLTHLEKKVNYKLKQLREF